MEHIRRAAEVAQDELRALRARLNEDPSNPGLQMKVRTAEWRVRVTLQILENESLAA